jgi:hypothetical protein
MPITTHSIDQVADLCPGAKKTPDGYRAPCPAHNGEDDNLHIWEKGGSVFLHCHSHKCSWPDLLRAIGLYQERSPLDRNIVDIYDYFDVSGTLLHQTVRYPKTQKPPFRQRRPDPASPGAYIWNLQGVETVLYRSPQVAKAIAEGVTLVFVEGEKDVHTAERFGFVATCNPMGAGKWRPLYSEQLTGARVVIIPDNDDKGRDHAALVAKELQGYAASVAIAQLPGLPEKGDLTDWVELGGTREQLGKLIAQAEPVGGQGDSPPSTPWEHIEHLPDFLANRVKMPEGLAEDTLYPGGVTVIAAHQASAKAWSRIFWHAS